MAIFNSRQQKKIRDFQDNALDALSKTHKLIFPPIFESCSSCLSPAISTYMGNVGLHGGPLPNLCTFCGGTGKIQKEVTENIQLEINYSPTSKVIQADAPNVQLPWDVILVKGYLKDLPKLQQCQEIQINLPSFPITSGRYKLSGDGLDAFNHTQGRYFLVMLVRIS